MIYKRSTVCTQKDDQLRSSADDKGEGDRHCADEDGEVGVQRDGTVCGAVAHVGGVVGGVGFKQRKYVADQDRVVCENTERIHD